jgi:hypothetical protein
MSYGDTTLEIELSSPSKDFDPARTIARVLDRDIPLGDTNVALIDGVDSSAPAIVDLRHVEPRFTGSDPVPVVIKRSSDLFEFLRCDVAVGDPQIQPMIDAICAQMRQ